MKNLLNFKNANEQMTKVLLLVLVLFISVDTAWAQKQVKKLVLVHGAFADGSGWEEVYKLLKKKVSNESFVANPNISFSEVAYMSQTTEVAGIISKTANLISK